MFSFLSNTYLKNNNSKSYVYHLINPEFKKYVIDSHLSSINKKLIVKDDFNKKWMHTIHYTLINSKLDNGIYILFLSLTTSFGIFLYNRYFLKQ